MFTQRVSNIVLACEGQNANALVFNIDKVLTQKLSDSIENKKRDIGKHLFESVTTTTNEEKKKDKPWKDTYESFEPGVQEAIDYVVETVVEQNLELENTIKMGAKQFNVSEERLREYFDQVTESVSVVSTSSDDHDEKKGVRDDEDINKRVRFESFIPENGGVVVFDNNTRYDVTPKQGKALTTVHNNLNESNQTIMVKTMKQNRSSFLNILDFSLRMVNG